MPYQSFVGHSVLLIRNHIKYIWFVNAYFVGNYIFKRARADLFAYSYQTLQVFSSATKHK